MEMIFALKTLNTLNLKKKLDHQNGKEEFLQKPLNERLSIASNMRDASQKNNNNKKESIMDVTPAAIEDFFEAASYRFADSWSYSQTNDS